MGDQSYLRDNVNIYAEGTLEATISANAGEFTQEVFAAFVSDGQLDLLFHDNGGSSSQWVVNSLLIQPCLERKFDFGTASSPVEESYMQVLHSTTYSTSTGYGWDSAVGLGSRDRGAPDNLRRDFVFSSSDHTFKVDLPNGMYLTTIIMGDQSYLRDNVNIYAEGTLEATISANAGEFTQEVFAAFVSDGQLNITFHDNGGTGNTWVINSVIIELSIEA
jgi:hypothetical protein